MSLTRRRAAIAIAATPLLRATFEGGPLVETHIHLFAADLARFPFNPVSYKPAPNPVDGYVKFAVSAGIDRAVIVHPEPYQDDHRYLEYCFTREPSPMFFKGTCLFDPIAPETPARMEALVKRNPGRIVALRIHEVRKPGEPPTVRGAIKDRDLQSPAMRATWRKAGELGLAIQMHFLPHFAPAIGELAARFPGIPVVLDHLARGGQGTPADYAHVLELARLPRVYMKYSGVNYSSHQPYPFADVKPLVHRAFDAFGPDRIVLGDLGHNFSEFQKQMRLFDIMFDFASARDRAAIRGGNALALFRWKT